MSDYRSYILPSESPPSLDSSDEKINTPDSLPSVPVSPSSPSDYGDFDRHGRNPTSLIFTESVVNNPDNFESQSEGFFDKTTSSEENLDICKVKGKTAFDDEKLEANVSSISNDNRSKPSSNIQSVLDSGNDLENVNYDNISNSNSNVNKCELPLIKMNNLKSANNTKKEIVDSSPRLMSTLTLTEDHPLMVLSSPDSPSPTGNYPDLTLMSCRENVSNENKTCTIDNNLLSSECSGIVSFSSTEEESFNKSITNGDLNSLHSESFSNQCEPQRNTSKNNLYFSENFLATECPRNDDYILDNIDKCRSVDECQSILIKCCSNSTTFDSTPSNVTGGSSENNERKIGVKNLQNETNNGLSKAEFSISQLQSKILRHEFPSNSHTEDRHSPDSSSASKAENSLYLAEVDPYEGCVVLKPRAIAPPVLPARKRIKPLSIETDTDSTALSNPTLFASCENEPLDSASSLESLSNCSLQSDECDNIRIFENPVNSIEMKKSTNSDNTKECSDTETETEGRSKRSCNERLSDTPEKIPEYSLCEERRDARLWHKVTLPNGDQRTIDMKVIEPYKRVLSHGGYALSGRRDAIVVFSACYLPDSSRVDYNYVMDNLFLYVLTTLEQLVTDDYILIYLHGSASKRSMPTFHWLKKCYQLIDRRLRKSLKHLYLVHPTFWLKSLMWMTRPFISSKFSRKLSYVYNLEELENLVPVEQAAIPERVRKYDSRRT